MQPPPRTHTHLRSYNSPRKTLWTSCSTWLQQWWWWLNRLTALMIKRFNSSSTYLRVYLYFEGPGVFVFKAMKGWVSGAASAYFSLKCFLSWTYAMEQPLISSLYSIQISLHNCTYIFDDMPMILPESWQKNGKCCNLKKQLLTFKDQMKGGIVDGVAFILMGSLHFDGTQYKLIFAA